MPKIKKMQKKKKHYVYLTTNLVNGKQYIGDHTINTQEFYYYLGSGTNLLNDIQIYGENCFFKEILEWFETKEEAFDSQKKYIKEFNTLKPSGYNIHKKGGWSAKGNSGIFSNSEKFQDYLESLKGVHYSPDFDRTIHIPMKTKSGNL